MNIALGVITVAGLTRDKVIGSRPDIGLAHAYMSLSISLSLHSRVSPSIFNTCSIMRVLTRSKGGAAYRYDENSRATFTYDMRIFHATQAYIYSFLFLG